MKRALLKRGKPLRRKTRLRARSKTSSYRRRPRDVDRMKWCRRQPCCANYMGGCSGRVEADHAGRRGVGQKADDSSVIPLCSTHHVQRTNFSGVFKSVDQMFMRQWLAEKVAYYRNEYEEHLSREARRG